MDTVVLQMFVAAMRDLVAQHAVKVCIIMDV